ncbi:MAG: hypothetical protein OXF79_02370, partial [Chloroflexi bacterium]|nr:hypothetical protein [Chloroflexota bacterium]
HKPGQPATEPSSPHTARTPAVHTSFPLDAAALPLCLAPREAVKISQQPSDDARQGPAMDDGNAVNHSV